jgi:hypothetical protein
VDELTQLEAIASELIKLYEIEKPPVPIETILQNPKDGMWEEVNVSQLTGSFMSIRDRFSPRMSLARLLARHLMMCDWGEERKVADLINRDEERMRAFAQMLIMPREMIQSLVQGMRNPVAISLQFEVPEEDAELRLEQLGKS